MNKHLSFISSILGHADMIKRLQHLRFCITGHTWKIYFWLLEKSPKLLVGQVE